MMSQGIAGDYDVSFYSLSGIIKLGEGHIFSNPCEMREAEYY
jgi:hypothetical protein